MVDIVIGAIAPTGPPTGQSTPHGQTVEAELLDIRPPRQRLDGPDGKERRRRFRQDPANGRVLTILVPNAAELPKDLSVNKYRVLLRFVKK